MQRVDLQTVNTKEEKKLRHLFAIHAQSFSLFMLFLVSMMSTGTMWMVHHLQHAAHLLVWAQSSRTPLMRAQARSLPHLLRTVPEYTGYVSDTNFLNRLLQGQ